MQVFTFCEHVLKTAIHAPFWFFWDLTPKWGGISTKAQKGTSLHGKMSHDIIDCDKSSAVAEMGDRLATVGMGRKLGGAAVGAGSPSNTMWRGPRPISLLSGIVIHPTVWPEL